MTGIPFDTMATARLLRDGGIEERQAAAITTAVKDGVTGGVATRTDLERVESALRTGIIRQEAELKAEFRWMKLIAAAVLAVLVLPWLAGPVSATMP